MVLPAVGWGVFLLGTRLAASKAGKAAAKYVVRKLGGKAAQKLGNPVSSHRTLNAAKNAMQKAAGASDKRKYGTTVAAYDLSHPETIELVKEGGRAAKKYGPDFIKTAMKDKKKIDAMVRKAKYKRGGYATTKNNRTKKRRK